MKPFERFDVKRGVLKKLGSGYLAGWKERFFVLDSYGSLRYYQDEATYAATPGVWMWVARPAVFFDSLYTQQTCSRPSTCPASRG